MNLRLVFICIAALSIFSTPANSQSIIDNIIQILKNLILLTTGGLKFISDALKLTANELHDITPSNKQEYDFIIVGAGSAGATIANRLTEIEEARVLLIEAGSKENLIMDIPLTAIYLELDKNKQWGYLTEPSNQYCLGIDNKQCKIPFGKGMGGTSSVNYMMVTRGNKKNYDTWAELTGDNSWSWDEMLKYFKKLEKYNVPLANTKREAHGYDGPVRVTNAAYQSPLVHAFVESGREFGFPTVVDYNSGQQTGFAYLQTNQINGERMSVNRAYLHPIKTRKNLFVSMNSHVNKVLINPETKTAYGVEFTKRNRKIEVIASKEVIVCAGAIGSPKILMLSGIGPAEHLQSFNISVLKSAPVGENLMDHIAYGGLSFLTNETESIVVPELIKPSNPALSDYLTKRSGPFTTPTAIEGLGYLNVDDSSLDNEEPNAEIIFVNIHFGSELLMHKVFGFKESFFKKFFGNTIFRHAYALFPVLIQPKSRGKVYLRSADPKDNPKIHANYFSDPEDIRVGIKIIKAAIEITKSKALQRYESRMNDAIVPGCENHVLDSDSYWECAFRTFTLTIWHHCGTCKMGAENDPSAVVNTKLQVQGIKNLRVADSSIMPMIPTAHLNIPTIAVAEKAADLIKSYWGFIN
ncbi:glucose dehydrogenase [FAD, quinone]-like [Phymastichus coffea]|uniref:glucose dehydrogenase [FAD, quinone]-like n=1 Tax=Phymastichus coffea TaxID=108790 RepID=UPI00273C357B|nr:glucose dehydrogenase [FAD, quinone]-like [Phymastichus coffea]